MQKDKGLLKTLETNRKSDNILYSYCQIYSDKSRDRQKIGGGGCGHLNREVIL